MFFFSCYVDHRDLHSFPTRRSSDLEQRVLLMNDSTTSHFDTSKPDQAKARTLAGALPWLKQYHGKIVVVDRKSTRLNSSHVEISYAVFCLKKKKIKKQSKTLPILSC